MEKRDAIDRVDGTAMLDRLRQIPPETGKFLTHVDTLGDIGFCFLDAEKEIYGPCYEAIVPRLVSQQRCP